jgi:DNA-binding MarR family transcriptional regulator
MNNAPPSGEVDETILLLQEVVQLFKSTLACNIGEVDLPFGQLRVLSHIYHQGRCTVGEVANGLGGSIANASELIDRLVEAGWIERGVNPNDRRQVVVSLTERALDVANRVHQMRRQQIGAALAMLEAGEQRAFVTGLKAVIGSLNDVLKPRTSIDALKHASLAS